MSINAIEVKDVTKVYRLYEKPIDRLKESLHPKHKSYHKDFYALNGLSFHVEKGQTVGIIGTNGSGKSTILKIITGVLTPTTCPRVIPSPRAGKSPTAPSMPCFAPRAW